MEELKQRLLTAVDTITLPDFDHTSWKKSINEGDFKMLIENHLKMIFLSKFNHYYNEPC